MSLSISSEGLWLRQGTSDGQTVIRATHANLDGTQLFDVTFITFAPGEGPTSRTEARSAELQPGAWALEDAKLWQLTGTSNPERDSVRLDRLRIPTDLTRAQIRDSFGTPSVIPIWELPAFIKIWRPRDFPRASTGCGFKWNWRCHSFSYRWF